MDPDGHAFPRNVRIGGLSKAALIAELEKNGIELNEASRAIFAHRQFVTAGTTTLVEIVGISVGSLGYEQGATFARIQERAGELGLSLCPVELGPHLRLQFLDQPEGELGHRPSQHRAPHGSLTVASRQLSEDDDVPKGFYLRRIAGVLWLRGYRAGPEHVWSPEDNFVFCRTQGTTWPSIEKAPR